MSVEHYTFAADPRPQWDTEEQEYWGEQPKSFYDRLYGQAPAVDRREQEKKVALIASDSGGNFKPVPAGTHIARCYRVIDLGTQETNYQGDIKAQRKVLIAWELFGEDEAGDPLQTDDGMPLIISKRYTLSLGKNARLRADLEAWRGRAFTDQELKGFDITALLGKHCMLNVIQESNNGKTYSNIASLTPIPGALKNSLPQGVHELQVFDVTEPNMDTFGKFHEKLQEIIRQSFEWRSQKESPKKATAALGADPDDDIPFANPYRGKLSYVV